MSLDVQLHHAQLHFGLIRPEKQDPVQTLATVEADHVVVERPALMKCSDRMFGLILLTVTPESLRRHLERPSRLSAQSAQRNASWPIRKGGSSRSLASGNGIATPSTPDRHAAPGAGGTRHRRASRPAPPGSGPIAMTILRGEGDRGEPTRIVGGRAGSPMDTSVSRACQIVVRSKRAAGTPRPTRPHHDDHRDGGGYLLPDPASRVRACAR